ncbi:MAG: sigma-70 family RNA polymerase sigma factor [Actinomycetota bacterium]|nr:sigma-70 family RNA polymerase sigma factor [Actinomycetota bacterium]
MDGSPDGPDGVAGRFEASRPRLRAVAYRMLGSSSEADDAVQEAWLRLSRSDADGVQNLAGWLTTVVARICLDMLRARASRREEPLDQQAADPAAADPGDPESEAVLADSVGLAMLIVLDTLAPAERVAFVLHDMFDLPFDQIAGITGRSPAAARQLASRARRRVRGTPAVPGDTLSRHKEIVEAFLAASRRGDFGALLALLDPDVELRADAAAVLPGIPRHVTGAEVVARQARAFHSRARFAHLALVDGAAGIVVAPGGRLSVVLTFGVVNGKVATIDVIADPGRLGRLALAVLEAEG